MNKLSLPPTLVAWQQPLRARWLALAPRERRMVAAAGAALLLLVVWIALVQPAWRTLREAPARLDSLDAQLQQMQRMAAESRELRGATPLSKEQATAALKAATDRLGDHGKLAMQGDRAVVTLTGVSGEQLRGWLADARTGARARPIDAQLTHGPQGYNGTLAVSLGSEAP